MRNSRRDGSPRVVIVLVSVIQFLIPFSYIAGGAARINAFLTNDDTYYYLQTAWNARHVGFVTFDGINATNGVQFLWFSILYGLSFLANDKWAFLALASTLAVVLTCLPYLIIWRFSEDTWGRPRSLLAVFAAFLWFIICLYPPNQYLVGLESPLHAFIIWAIVFQYARVYREMASGQVRSSSVLLFVLLLVLNTWTRLDSFGLSASFLVLLLLTITGRLPARTYAIGAALVAAGIVVLFGFFQQAGGSLLPVSALVKGHAVDRFSLGAFYNWSLVLFPLRIQGANLLNVFGIVAMFASLGMLLRMRPVAGDRDWAALRLIAIALGVAVIIHSIATFGMFRYYYFWYLSATFVYWTITLPIFLGGLADRKAWRHGVIAASGFGVAAPLVCFWWLTATPNDLAATRFEAARWIDANLEEDAVLASFNAGQLGFFSNRSVVNLDGLINHVTYFENVLKSGSPDALASYMDEVGIDYVVDYQFGRWREIVESRFTPIREFGLASGGTIKVMARRRDIRPSRAWQPEPRRSHAGSIFHTNGR